MTQAEFGQEIGVEQATISRWEKGIQPSGAKLTMLVDFMLSRDIPVNSLPMFANMTNKEASEFFVNMVPMVGFVDETSRVKLIGDDNERRVTRCYHTTFNTVAVQEEPRFGYRRQTANYYFENKRLPPTERILGNFAIFEADIEGILIGRLYPSPKKDQYLIEMSGHSVVGPCKIRWAAPITWIFYSFEG